MAKRRSSGTYLGTTRRQRNRSMRSYIVLCALLFLLIAGTIVLLFFFFRDGGTLPLPIPDDREKPSDTAGEHSDAPYPDDTVYKASQGEAWIVMLDPGHGFDDPGSASAYLDGTNEACITLDIAKRLGKMLGDAGITVLYTHTDNNVGGRTSVSLGGETPESGAVTLSPAERVALADGAQIDLFLSLHCDSLPEGSDVAGMRVYCHDKTDAPTERNAAVRHLAVCLADALPKDADGNTAQMRVLPEKSAYAVIRDTDAPAVLCELGYVSKEGDAASLSSSDGRESLARALFDGLGTYLRISPDPDAEFEK